MTISRAVPFRVLAISNPIPEEPPVIKTVFPPQQFKYFLSIILKYLK